MSLRELSEIAGVSGDEGRVREYIWEAVKHHVDGGRVDPMGNLITWKGLDKPGPRLMIAAHMDEVGFMITHVEQNGLLRFEKVGGIDDRVLPAKAVHVGPNAVPGVIGMKPIHLLSPGERRRPLSHDQLYIDIGATSKEEATGHVKPGDYVTFATDYAEFGDGLAQGKAFDDRVGCSLLMELVKEDVPYPLFAVFTVQEEIGLRGARVAAYDIDPDAALVLEGTTCADIPETEEHGQATTLGAGPAITFMDRATIPARPLVEGLVQTATDNDIPWQWRRTTFGGTDAGSIHLTRAGIPAATVSVPCRYIHSPCAYMSLGDYDNALRLLKAFLPLVPDAVPHVADVQSKGDGRLE